MKCYIFLFHNQCLYNPHAFFSIFFHVLILKLSSTNRKNILLLILQLNSTSLEQKVIDELESNPLLDQPESIQENDEEELKEDKEVDYEDDPDEFEPRNVYNNQSEDFEIPIVQQFDFLEDLSQQLNEFDLEEKEQNIAEEIIWNLDENGYLAIDTILISDRLGTSEDEVERILLLVQQLSLIHI